MKFNIINDANKKEILNALREEIGSSNMSVNVFLTEKDQIFQRAITFRSKKELNLIKPTIDGGLFTNYFDTIEDLEGFFCGDPDEWIPILLRDQYLSSEANTSIAILDLIFPEGTIYINHKRSVDILGNESILDEQFIVYDKPIKPHGLKILSESELEEFDLKARSMTDPSELGEQESEENENNEDLDSEPKYIFDINSNTKIQANKDLLNQCAKVFGTSFMNYPLFIYYFPEEKGREEKLTLLHKILLCYNLNKGNITIYQDNGIIKGVLMDISLKEWKIDNLQMVKCNATLLPLKLGLPFMKKQTKIEEIMNKDHIEITKNQLHSYLWAIGVDPKYQGEGIGKKLILNYIERNKDILKYLETCDKKNVDIYSKYGFKLVKTTKTNINDLNNFCMKMQ